MKKSVRNLLIMAAILTLAIAGVQSTFAQTFKRVTVADGSQISQVSSGGASVWALSTSGHPYIYKSGQFSLAKNTTLTQISVGGGNVVQKDDVWALDGSGNVYRALLNGTTWNFNKIAGVLDFIVVGAGYQDKCHPYEVWGLNSSAQIYRYDYCAKAFQFIQGTLGTIAIGGGDIWGINGNGEVFRFNFSTLAFDQVQGVLQSLAAGPNGLWGLNGGLIYEFQDDSLDFSGIAGVLAQISAGGNGVWGLNGSGTIFRLEPSSSTFVKVPGVLTSISVGSGGGVWGVNSSKQVFAYSIP